MRVILLAMAILMVEGFDLQAIGFVAPEIAKSWAVNISAFGPVFSAGLAGSMIGCMAAGPVARVAGLRRLVALSLLVFGAFTLLIAWVNSLTLLAVLRFIVGLGLGASIPVVMSIVADNSAPRFRATLVVVALCGQPIGAIVGAALCARLIPIHGWQSAFYLGGTVPLLLILPLRLIPRERTQGPGDRSTSVYTSADPASSGPKRLRDIFGRELLTMTTLLWIGAFLTTSFLYIIVNWLPSAVRASGYTLQSSVLMISLFNIGGIAGALLLGLLMDRFGPFKVMPFAFGIAGLAMAAIDASRAAPVWLMATSFLSGLAGYGAGLSYASLTLMLYPQPLQTTAVGYVVGIGRLGAAIGPLLAGLALSVGFAIGRLFYFAAAAAILVMLCLLCLSRNIRTRRQLHNPSLVEGLRV